MSAVFAMFLAQFVAPIPIAVGIAGAFVARAWWHVLITAVVAASIGEVYVRMTKVDHSFSALGFPLGVVAAGLWAAWFYWLRLARLQNK